MIIFLKNYYKYKIYAFLNKTLHCLLEKSFSYLSKEKNYQTLYWCFVQHLLALKLFFFCLMQRFSTHLFLLLLLLKIACNFTKQWTEKDTFVKCLAVNANFLKPNQNGKNRKKQKKNINENITKRQQNPKQHRWW